MQDGFIPGPHEEKYDRKLDDLRRQLTQKIREVALRNQTQLKVSPYHSLRNGRYGVKKIYGKKSAMLLAACFFSQ